MGDGESECKYFDDLNGMVKRIRIRPRELGVTGWQKIIEKCDGHGGYSEEEAHKGVRAGRNHDEDHPHDAEREAQGEHVLQVHPFRGDGGSDLGGERFLR